MWGIIFIIFLGLYSLMSYYIGRRAWTSFGKTLFSKKLFWGLFLLLIFAFPASKMLENSLPVSSGFLLAVLGGYSMIAVLYIFLILLFIDLILLLNKRIGFIPAKVSEHKKTPLLLSALVILTIITTLTYGTWNANHPIVTEYNLKINKENKFFDQLRIAMVSDIHFGAIIDRQRVSKMVDTINELQPDLVLIAGDITEGNPTDPEARELAEALGQLQAKYGIYAVPGNHDRGLRNNDSALSHYFREADVQVLKDDYILIEDSLYIIGRDDLGYRSGSQRKNLADLVDGVDDSLPMILIDHQPIDIDIAQNTGVDLQVSGHTHKGQIFPANFITGQIFELDWGLLKEDNYHLIVSNGYGTWGPPIRIGNNPEVVSITVQFK